MKSRLWPKLNKFISHCLTIERDPNFQPKISDRELLLLVSHENGSAKHTPPKTALAIQPLDKLLSSPDGDSMGIAYQFKMAQFGLEYDNDLKPCWHIHTKVIVVLKTGDISIHDFDNIKKNNLNLPLKNLTLDNYLRCECLHYHHREHLKIG